jgi:hypothetical protein
MFFATNGSASWAFAAFLAAIIVIGVQAMLVRCPSCHARPGLWILAAWTVFVDIELYVSDVLLLRDCVRCRKPLR